MIGGRNVGRAGWQPASLVVAVDHEHGGRWTSLRAPEREWLWARPDVAVSRAAARPGDDFVDAGGLEECFPTINGVPDHGDVWSRPWSTAEDGSASVTTGDGLRLHRAISIVGGTVQVRYRVGGLPGTPFLHAAHALLDVGPHARWKADGARRLLTPNPSRTPLEHLGPDDGTAVSAIVDGARRVELTDGDHRLTMEWRVPAEAPSGLLVWRNLGGWPESGPYRSVGIEPLVGSHSDLDAALATGLPVPRIGSGGSFEWSLRIRAERRT